MVDTSCAACLCLYLSYHIIKRTCPKREVDVDLGAKLLQKILKTQMSHLQKEFREWTTPEFLWWLDLTYFKDGFHRFVDMVRIQDLIVNESINGKHLVKIWGVNLRNCSIRYCRSRNFHTFLTSHADKMRLPRDCGKYISWRFE